MSDKQWRLIYYKLEEQNALFAYGEYYEFFERYDVSSRTWRPSEISYSRFLHDFNGTVVDENAASAMTGGNLPDKKYEEYRCMLNRCAESGKDEE